MKSITIFPSYIIIYLNCLSKLTFFKIHKWCLTFVQMYISCHRHIDTNIRARAQSRNVITLSGSMLCKAVKNPTTLRKKFCRYNRRHHLLQMDDRQHQWLDNRVELRPCPMIILDINSIFLSLVGWVPSRDHDWTHDKESFRIFSIPVSFMEDIDWIVMYCHQIV